MGPAGMDAVAGLVSRVTVTPPMLQTAVAFNVNVPALVLLIVTVHVRVFPAPARSRTRRRYELGVGEIAGVIEVSDTGVAPAGDAVVLIVNTCCDPTSFVAVNGVIEILASTYCLTAVRCRPAPAGMFAVAGSCHGDRDPADAPDSGRVQRERARASCS